MKLTIEIDEQTVTSIAAHVAAHEQIVADTDGSQRVAPVFASVEAYLLDHLAQHCRGLVQVYPPAVVRQQLDAAETMRKAAIEGAAPRVTKVEEQS